MIKIPRYRCAPGAFPPRRVAKSPFRKWSLPRVYPQFIRRGERRAANGALIIGYTGTNPVSSITPHPEMHAPDPLENLEP
jgi:hypothetical protein